MLIRKRGPMTQLLEEPGDIEADDVFNEESGDKEIAA
jgi:hypothetical protein